jgi:hypothetical protein
LWFGGEDNPPPDEWVEFILLTEIYRGMNPLDIEQLPAERVDTDLLLYQIREQRRAELSNRK